MENSGERATGSAPHPILYLRRRALWERCEERDERDAAPRAD